MSCIKGSKHTEETKAKMRLAHLGEKNHFYGKKHSPEIMERIASKLRGEPSWNKGKKLTEEHKAKLRGERKCAQAENSFRWIVDRTQLKDDYKNRGGQLHRDWSRSVKNRDGWLCCIANGDCSGHVVAHHILSWKDHPELRYQINNGITLCHAHHPRKRAEEKRLAPYFTELVSVSKD